MKEYLALMRRTDTGTLPPWYTMLLTSLEPMAASRSTGPPVFLHFDGRACGLKLPILERWPTVTGYTFYTWMRAEGEAQAWRHSTALPERLLTREICVWPMCVAPRRRPGFYRPGYPESARYKPRLLAFRSVDTSAAVELFISNHVLHLAVEHDGHITIHEFGHHVFQMRRCARRAQRRHEVNVIGTADKLTVIHFAFVHGVGGTSWRSPTKHHASAGARATSRCTSTANSCKRCAPTTPALRRRPISAGSVRRLGTAGGRPCHGTEVRLVCSRARGRL